MRIVRFLLISVVVLAVVGAMGFLGVREALLTWGTWRLNDGIARLVGVAAVPGQFEQQCVNTFKLDDTTTKKLHSVELAFTDATHFQVQVVCEANLFQPIVVQQYQLPPLVTKAPGSAGFVYSKTIPTAVTLQIWGRSASVVFNQTKIQVQVGSAAVTSDLTPLAVCQGFGFSCCQDGSTVGAGDQAVGAADCPKSCFAQCRVRPVILSFNSEPFYDPQTRILTVTSGGQVTFSFSSNLSDAQVKESLVTFGDGQSSRVASGSALVTHTYFCSAVPCLYQAAIKVTDQQGLSNSETTINKLLVKVN